ncbi:MAG: hypothetical protein IPQ08_03460 [Chitinophagaceae bacterium]|nr:hypothetical protein [Chitinophagaceae bacterium]
MKKFLVLTMLASTVFFLSNCGSAKKAAAPRKLTYKTDISVLIDQNCSPCHIPSKGGKKKAFDNYASVKMDIDDMIKRIDLQPTDRGFMPFRGKKLSDSTINAFKQWRTDGVLEN